ncbi:MAG: hypothetical protein IKK53_04365 [Ruminiclostridium sp.]|nr:hypothetical protein [Ruminiclostridium sp.]MBR4112247.1 hypothetical protein [Ruminiclostridium sp.]
MDVTVIAAIVSALCSLVGTFGGILVSSKLTAYRLEQLEKRVAEHNNFAIRLPVIEEQIKELSRRIDEN